MIGCRRELPASNGPVKRSPKGTAMEPLFLIVFVLVVAGVAIAWHYGRSNSILHQWAERNGYRILHQEYRHFFKGPYFWRSSKNQTVYHVQVEDRLGNRRSAYVRCGGW